LLATGLNELLVSKSLDILNVFNAHREANMWVNEIVRRVTETTGSRDRPGIKKSIDFLERALMIETISSASHKQKEIKIPTSLGKEVLKLIDDLRKCNYSYTKLKGVIIEYNFKLGEVQDPDEQAKIVRRKLLKKGWDKQDVESFHGIMHSAFRMESIYRSTIFNCMLYRYSSIKYEYDVNEIADRIITEIMMLEIHRLFLLAVDLEEINSKFESDQYYFSPEKADRITDVPFVDIYDTIEEEITIFYYWEDAVLTNMVISDIIEEVTLSMFSLLQPDKKYVKEIIADMKSTGGIKGHQGIILSKIKGGLKYSDTKTQDLAATKLRDIYIRYLAQQQ
jgi:hypothetical protein